MRKRFPQLRVAMATWRRSSHELQQKTLHPEFPQATCHASVGFVATVHRTYWSSFCGGKLPRTFGLLHQGGDETGNICLDLQQRVRRRIRKQPTNVLRHVCQQDRQVDRLCPLMPSRKGLGQIALELNLFHSIWRMISRSVSPADNLSRNCACSSRNRCLGDFLGDSDMTLSPFL